MRVFCRGKAVRKFSRVAAVIFCYLLVLSGFIFAAAQADEKPDFSLAEVYDESQRLADYWMSEKYDGVRALWDGSHLISRGGNVYQAPDWFVAGLPPQPLDGELWLARGQFEETLSIVRQSQPHEGWRAVRYMVFDLPAHQGVFRVRYAAMLTLHAANNNPYWRIVQQRPIASAAALEQYYAKVLAGGGEGVMLRRIESLHRGGRSDDLLKHKPFADAEAVIIGYNPGKGKYTGMVGSLRVRGADGTEFNVGSGLSDVLRQSPPPLGTVITYKYQGLTGGGKPRFPVFLRVRADAPITEN